MIEFNKCPADLSNTAYCPFRGFIVKGLFPCIDSNSSPYNPAQLTTTLAMIGPLDVDRCQSFPCILPPVTWQLVSIMAPWASAKLANVIGIFQGSTRLSPGTNTAPSALELKLGSLWSNSLAVSCLASVTPVLWAFSTNSGNVLRSLSFQATMKPPDRL